MFAKTGLLVSILGLAVANGAAPPFDPSHHKLPAEMGPSEVLTLGTPHLSGWPESFNPANLSLLMDRLAAWQPKIIAVETLSGAQCAYMKQHKVRYAESYDAYCWDPAPAQKATGLDVVEAIAEVNRLLSDPATTRTPAGRRHLAALFLASGEQASALVQWLSLPEKERHTGDGLDDVLVERLNTIQNRNKEEVLIAARLAVRLGLDRVIPMDDHTADAAPSDPVAFGAAVSKAWDNPVTKQRIVHEKDLEAHIDSDEGVLNLYRAYNRPGLGAVVYGSDFGAALMEPSPERYGRHYVAGWETRNLRMIANIREAMIDHPGARVLVIVGASHKPYFDAYLNMMHDVNIANAEAVLK